MRKFVAPAAWRFQLIVGSSESIICTAERRYKIDIALIFYYSIENKKRIRRISEYVKVCYLQMFNCEAVEYGRGVNVNDGYIGKK